MGNYKELIKATAKQRASKLDAYVGTECLSECGGVLREKYPGSSIAVVTDAAVDALYGEKLMAGLRDAGITAVKFTLPAETSAGSAESFARFSAFLAEHRFEKKDVVLALGGTGVCNLAGFTAGTYLEGIRFVAFPTTLNAMVNCTADEKRSIAAGVTPDALTVSCKADTVFCDTDIPKTLSPAQLCLGRAEFIRCAMIGSSKLISVLQGDYSEQLDGVIQECMAVRSEIFAYDSLSKGTSIVLNFGNTVGDAILRLSGGSVSKGEALAVGMAVITKAAVKNEMCDKECYFSLMRAIQNNALPSGCTLSAEQIYEAVVTPADVERGIKTVVIPAEAGKCSLYPVPIGHLLDFIRSGL